MKKFLGKLERWIKELCSFLFIEFEERDKRRMRCVCGSRKWKGCDSMATDVTLLILCALGTF